ncbi:MAG TPA: isopentenyl-diphosphate Delta-isomerase [Euzebyales bacterium]
MSGPGQVVLLDAEAGVVGAMDKLAAHQRAVRHLAFSVMLRDDDGAILLQRRAEAKYHFAGRWSNACCSHPRPDESVTAAARRRVREELGAACGPLAVSGAFWYRADDPASGLVEHEYDVVLVGAAAALTSYAPDPAEVDDLRFVQPTVVRAALEQRPQQFTPWLAQVLDVTDGGGAPVVADIPV